MAAAPSLCVRPICNYDAFATIQRPVNSQLAHMGGLSPRRRLTATAITSENIELINARPSDAVLPADPYRN